MTKSRRKHLSFLLFLICSFLPLVRGQIDNLNPHTLLSQRISGFAGFYFGEEGDLIVAIAPSFEANNLNDGAEIQIATNFRDLEGLITDVYASPPIQGSVWKLDLLLTQTDPRKKLRVVPATYTYQELEKWMQHILSPQGLENLGGVGISEQENKIVVGIVGEPYVSLEQSFREVLKRSQIPENAVRFESQSKETTGF